MKEAKTIYEQLGCTYREEKGNLIPDVDEQAHEMLTSLTAELAKTQGIDEHLKATDQMRWVQMMNNVRNTAEEILMRELILA